MFSGALMPRPTDDDALGLREIDGLLGLAERRLGLLPDGAGVDGRDARARAPAAPPFCSVVDAEGADLERDEVRRRPLGDDVGVRACAWNIGRTNAEPLAVRLRRPTQSVTMRAVEPRRQLRREVARLVGVRRRRRSVGALGRDERGQRRGVAVGGVRPRAPARSSATHLRRPARAGELGGGRARVARPGDDDRHRLRRSAAPRRSVSQLARLSCAVPLFRDDENHEHRLLAPQNTRASSRSTRTSSLAASAGDAGDHPRLLRLLGEVEADDLLAGGDRPAGGSTPADLLLLRRHDALERGVAQLVDAALDGQQRRQRHRHPLEPAALELALHAQRRRPRPALP